MELYQVGFQAHFENMVDIGSILVVASGADAAGDTALAYLDLPRSRTQLDVRRIKLNLYQIERRAVSKTHEKRPGSERTQQGPLQQFQISVSTIISGRSEEHALRQVSHLFADQVTGRKAVSKKALAIECRLIEQQRRLNNMEQVELYKARV